MPTHRIQVTEYQCCKCGYKWINRLNGRDGNEPTRWAKCKRTNWNKGSPTPEEVGLRRRVRYLERLYTIQLHFQWGDKTFQWPKGLIAKFLSIDPTIVELKQVLHAGELGLNSQNQFRGRGFVPDQDGRWLKYDPEAYKILLKQDAHKQQELMKQIIDSRKNNS